MNPANFPRNRERKQAEALARQTASAALTPQERLAALDRHGFRAVKERAKLAKRQKALDIVETQPMTGTSGLVDFKVHGSNTVAEPAEPKPRRKGRDEKRGAKR